MSNKDRVVEMAKRNESLLRILNDEIRREIEMGKRPLKSSKSRKHFKMMDDEEIRSIMNLVRDRPYLYRHLDDGVRDGISEDKDFFALMRGVEGVRGSPFLIKVVKKEIRECALRDPEIYLAVMNELGIKNHMDFNEDNINKLLGMISDEVEEDMFFGDTTSANCPKCDNDKATFKRLSIWADEPDLIIYRCTKCGFSWRSGGVSGV